MLEKCGAVWYAVQKIIKDSFTKTHFKDGTPGKKWFTLFLKRNRCPVTRKSVRLLEKFALFKKHNYKISFVYKN